MAERTVPDAVPAERRLVRFDALADGSLTRREHRGTAILLCRVGAEVHVVADRCTHEDVSLSLGSLCGHRLRCPLHGSAFDVRSGEALDEPAEEPLATWPVAIEDGWVTIADEVSPLDERPPSDGSAPPGR